MNLKVPNHYLYSIAHVYYSTTQTLKAGKMSKDVCEVETWGLSFCALQMSQTSSAVFTTMTCMHWRPFSGAPVVNHKSLLVVTPA